MRPVSSREDLVIGPAWTRWLCGVAEARRTERCPLRALRGYRLAMPQCLLVTAGEPHSGRSEETEAPDCPRCGTSMVRRRSGKGASKGQQFWGCPKFPKCRGSVSDPPPALAEAKPLAAAESPKADRPKKRRRGLTGRLAAAATQVVEAVDKAQRRQLESDEPDATGRWDPEHRSKVLRYVYDRDDGRCGLCAGEMKLKGAHIEHIVPKVFAVFDVRKGGVAEPGTQYTSRLHKLDNLQAAHTYCNKRKGNTPKVREWRHPAMPSLPVADTADGTQFVLPFIRPNRT